MNTNSYKEFLANCKKEISKEKKFDFSDSNFEYIAADVFRNVEKIKQIASNIRYKFINSIDDSLISFDKHFSENGGNIHWCIAYDDFLLKLDKVLIKNKIKKINLYTSSFSDELGISSFIKENDYKAEPESSDCVIFTPEFGIVNTGSMFLNFSSAYDMEMVLNGSLKIFILPISDFLFKPEETEIFSHLYSIYKDGTKFPYITSMFTPSPVDKNSNVHLFLIDNGRSNVLENQRIRRALTCISCGACKRVCPVYKIIGDKPYDNVFTGPIANAILPFIENIENYKHLCFTCTSCGNCSSVCPVKIPVSELILANRNYFFENRMMDIKDVRFANSIGKMLVSRKSLNKKRWMKVLRLKSFTNSQAVNEYSFSKSTFNQQFIAQFNDK